MKIINLVWILIGSVSLALGLVGVFLPVLPTTPFLLVTLVCFTKGSPRLKNWFLTTNLYKKNLKEFQEKKAIPLKTKIIILAFASTMLLLAFYFTNNLYARILIVCVFVAKYFVFIGLRL